MSFRGSHYCNRGWIQTGTDTVERVAQRLSLFGDHDEGGGECNALEIRRLWYISTQFHDQRNL